MEVERTAEYFDYLAGLPDTHLHRVFCWFGIYFCTNQTPGKIQEGGRNPLLGRFKGDCKGARTPARIQRSDSCGKRRNNETDETCRLRQGEGCEVCSDANSPLPFSFYRQRLFLCRAKKKGLKRSPRMKCADKVCTPCTKKPPASSGCAPSAPAARLRPAGRGSPCACGTDEASPPPG